MDPIAFLNNALEELRHVRWPTRQQAIRLSAIVLVFIAVCAVVFGVVDALLAQLVTFLLSIA
jgi:preprotein translocase SecE subunit